MILKVNISLKVEVSKQALSLFLYVNKSIPCLEVVLCPYKKYNEIMDKFHLWL